MPANESLYLNKCIYEVEENEYKKNLACLTELLGARDLLKVQVRRLSLGERMKMELIASLLHKPKVLFLDEPTIGLDIISQRKIREFLADYNKQYKTTVILTSHYMQDIEDLCKRSIVINQGRIVYDGDLKKINEHFNADRIFFIQGLLLFGTKITSDLHCCSYLIMCIAFAGYHTALNIEPYRILFFITALILALLLNFLMSYIISLIAFWITEAWAAFIILNMLVSLASGGIFPLDIFGHKVMVILNCLPFKYVIFYPISIINGKCSFSGIFFGIAMQLVWLAALVLISKGIWDKGLKKYVAVGG